MEAMIKNVNEDKHPATNAVATLNDKDDDEIVEVPVPTKPPAPVITLDNDGEPFLEQQQTSSESQTATNSPEKPTTNKSKQNDEEASSLILQVQEPIHTSPKAPPVKPCPNIESLGSSAISIDVPTTSNPEMVASKEDDGSDEPQSKFKVLQVLGQRENDLFQELEQIDARRRDILRSLEYLRNLRNETIASGLADEWKMIVSQS